MSWWTAGAVHRIIKFAKAELAKKFDGDITHQTFSADGDATENNWEDDASGQDYIQRIRAEGRPDVLEWARAVLAPRVQAVFERYSREQFWGDPGVQDSESAAEPGSDAPGNRRDRTVAPGPRLGQVDVIGTHFSQVKRTTVDGSLYGRDVEFGAFRPAHRDRQRALENNERC